MSEKKYISVVLNRVDDSDLIENLSIVTKIMGVSNREIVEMGVKEMLVSDKFKEKVKKLKELLG